MGEIDWNSLPVVEAGAAANDTGEIDWDNLPVVDGTQQPPAAHSPRMTREERIAQNQRAIERAQQPGDGEDGFDLAVLEGVKGAARAVKSIGGGIVGMASGAVRLAGTPVRAVTGWEGLHRLADTIDSSYENFGRDALMSEYGENPDGWGYALGRAGEKVAGVAGSLAALGGVGKAVGAAGAALKMAGHAKTAAAVANTLPLMFGNDAAVRAYDTARANGKSKGEAAALAGLNGAIHFLGFKAFENQSLKKMLNIGPEVEVMMPKWADALAEEGGQSFSSLVRGTRNGMIKYIAAERGKGALKAGGIMGLQNMLSDPVMQVAEGADIDDIDFSRMLKAGAHGVGEGALMEGLMGGAAIFRSQKAAEKFMADKFFRGKDYKVMGADGKMHDEPGLLNSEQGRMMLMKQNPAATERVLDIVEHGGTPRPAELDAAFLPPDMTKVELEKFASDWRNDLKPYVDEAWNADQPTRPAPPAETAEAPQREFLSAEEAAEQRGDAQAAIGQPPKQETPDETGNGAAEAPAQPEQAEVVAPPAGAEARPVESAEAPAEAADARVVESPAKPAEAAQKPMEAAERADDPFGFSDVRDIQRWRKTLEGMDPIGIKDYIRRKTEQGIEDEFVKAAREELLRAEKRYTRRLLEEAHKNEALENTPFAKIVDDYEQSDRVLPPDEIYTELSKTQFGRNILEKISYEFNNSDESQPFPKERLIKLIHDDLHKLIPESAQPAEKPPTTTPKPTEAQTPAEPAKPAEAASRVSDAKSNRLRRADGTDPLAEKPMPKTLQKAVYKISSAIANRTGTGVITPDEAYGIVKGIAESPRTKHNRTRDFFGPLEKDAAWHESMGLDAESAKNIRDAFDRVKADADLKKWFPQVDSAVKKAKDGKLSRTDAVPLFGKISEGLEKAERMGLSEAANKLREAAEVIRPVAEAVTQGDVGKFNYSTKGRKFNNRLGGTDKRGGKTVSLDTKNGTVDVGADGRTLDDVIDEGADASHDRRSLKPGESYGKGFTGEERDAGGEPIETNGDGSAGAASMQKPAERNGAGVKFAGFTATIGENGNIRLTKTFDAKDEYGRDVERQKPVEISQEQFRAMAKQFGVDADAMLEKMTNGKELEARASKSAESPAERDLRFASDENYQKWLKSRKANDAEPLRERYEQEQAKAAKSIAKNALPGVDVEIVDRAFNPETDGGNRYLRDGEGRVVGTFDRSTNKVKLYRGASAATLVHELGGHATLRFAEQEAERGNRQLLDRINRAIDEAPQALKDEIRSRYPGVDETALRDEIWAALRERNSPAMEKAIKTLQGKAWYNRAWSAFRDAWKGLLARMGFNRADLSQIDKMSNDEFLSHLDRIMSDGKTLGRLEAMGEGTRANPLAESQESVREARSPRHAGSRIMDDQQTKGEKFTEKFINSLAPVKSVQEELGGVKEVTRADGYTDHTKSTDLVAAKDKANGRLEHEVRQHQSRVDDINRDLSRAALAKQSTEDLVDDFNLYLQCKHAPERNLSVAQDRGDAYTPDYSEGMGQITLPGGNRIGLSENVANRLLKGLRGKYGLKFKMFENAADKVYKMLEADLDRRFDAERLSAEDYAFYKTRWHGPGGADGKWAHYVPLKTDMERLEPEALNSSTAGMKRNEFMKARGRGTGDIADSPLAAAVLQTEQGIRGSIRNEVANVEANLVEHAQKQGIPIAEIVPGDEIRRGRTYSFTFADGETVDASGSMRLVENHPEIHLFKRDGKLYAIRYDKGANGRGLAFARAASGENMGRWGQGTEWIPRMTHWMSAMRTQYSPEFTVSNWLADHLEAAQALVGRYGLKEGGKAFAKTIASEIQNWKDLRAYLKDGTANGYIKEFVEGGGLTKGGVASEGFDAETQKIRSKIEQFRREQKQWREMSPADLAKSAGRHIADFLSFANELAEYSTRTGLYTALRKQGVPRADAIKFARDATVNFNRKGTAMPYINGLYMFANASVQGAVRSVQAMRDTHGKELVAALTAIGVAKAVIDNYLGNDDEREAAGGRNARNQSEYDKKHNVGVPIGGGRQIVPLRFRGPYAAVPYLAQTAANVAMGATSPEDGAKTLVRELGNQVTDIVGGNGIMNDRGEFDGSLIGQSIAPSVADPIVQLATGKDYKGDERRRKSFDKTMPASSNGKRNTGDWYKVAAQTLNRMSGGNEHRKGLVDVAPEDLQLVLEFLGGAPMRDLNNVVSSVNNAVQLAAGGTPERTLSQIPFVRRVVREYPESTSRYYTALEEYERDKAEFKKTTPERRREMKSEKPYLFTGKSLLDGQIERIKDLTHLERGEVKVGQKWVEPKTPRTEEQKEKYRKLRLEMQARVLKRLGE